MARAQRTTLEDQDSVRRRTHALTAVSGLIAASYVFVLVLICSLAVADGPQRGEALGSFLRGFGLWGYIAAATGALAAAVLLHATGGALARPFFSVGPILLPRGSQARATEAIAELSIAAGIDAPPVRVIDSEAVNACVVGVGRRPTIIFTSAACDLAAEQLHALAAHEVACICSPAVAAVAASRVALRRLWRLVQAAYALAVAGSVVSIVTNRTVVGAALLGGFMLLTIVAAPVLVLAAVIESRDARAAELIADIEALRLHESPAAFVALGLDVADADRRVSSPLETAVWFDRNVVRASALDFGPVGARQSLLDRIALASEAAEGGGVALHRRVERLLEIEELRRAVGHEPGELRAARVAVWVLFVGGGLLVFAGSAAGSDFELCMAAALAALGFVAVVVRRRLSRPASGTHRRYAPRR